ncbi:MAG: hypothetical protein WCH37_07905, partial [Synechococcaceae cyanobacterium ELA182]
MKTHVRHIEPLSSQARLLFDLQRPITGHTDLVFHTANHRGSDELHRDCCHALYKSPGTTGWCSIAIFPRTSRQPYETVALHGYSGNRFGSLPPSISASLHSNGHQLRSGIAIGHYDLVLDPQGLLDSPPPLIQLPAPLFIGCTSIRGASTHFGKVTRPDGLMLQLGQPLDVGFCPELLAGVQRAALHQRPTPRGPAACGSAACGPAAGDGHGGLHSQLPTDECRRHPPA